MVAGYLAARGARLVTRLAAATTIDVMFCIADHFEPDHHGADRRTRLERVARWVDGYPRLADGLYNADGLPPRHSFFFPAEIFCPRNSWHRLLNSAMRARGSSEVSICITATTHPTT